MNFITILEQYWHESLTICDKGMLFVYLMQFYLQETLYYAICFNKVWIWGEFSLYKDLGGHDIGIDSVAQTTHDVCWPIESRYYQKSVVINSFRNYHMSDTNQSFFLYHNEETKREKTLFNNIVELKNTFYGYLGSRSSFILEQDSKIYNSKLPFIIDLLLSVIVSVKALEIVKKLPKIKFEVLNNQVT